MLAKKQLRRNKIRYKIRKKVAGIAAKPRMSVYRSNKDIYVQLIDDEHGHTIAAASSREISDDKSSKIEQSEVVGKNIAEKAKAAGISEVTFDRGGYLYHGRVKALAEGARQGGLKF